MQFFYLWVDTQKRKRFSDNGYLVEAIGLYCLGVFRMRKQAVYADMISAVVGSEQIIHVGIKSVLIAVCFGDLLHAVTVCSSEKRSQRIAPISSASIISVLIIRAIGLDFFG